MEEETEEDKTEAEIEASNMEEEKGKDWEENLRTNENKDGEDEQK